MEQRHQRIKGCGNSTNHDELSKTSNQNANDQLAWHDEKNAGSISQVDANEEARLSHSNLQQVNETSRTGVEENARSSGEGKPSLQPAVESPQRDFDEDILQLLDIVDPEVGRVTEQTGLKEEMERDERWLGYKRRLNELRDAGHDAKSIAAMMKNWEIPAADAEAS